jgi:type II secretory pathway pseudopilin PulG
VYPAAAKKVMTETDHLVNHAGFSPYTFVTAVAVPSFVKAVQTFAKNQTLANEGQIVCALERYHLAHNEYPETLDALQPESIAQLPHDLIGGQPLHYHRTSDGKFVLYSIGWNEKNDDGQVALKKDGTVDRENGDWVWQYPQK